MPSRAPLSESNLGGRHAGRTRAIAALLGAVLTGSSAIAKAEPNPWIAPKSAGGSASSPVWGVGAGAGASKPASATPATSLPGQSGAPKHFGASPYVGALERGPYVAEPGAIAESAPADHVLPPQEPTPPDVAFDLAVVAKAPLMIGGQATLEIPGRILLQAELGVLPGFSLDAADSALVSGGAYNEATSELVRSTLRNSLVSSLSLGWRPFPSEGFEVSGGYTVAALGGDVSARKAVEAITGVTLPNQIPDTELDVHSTVHAVHLSVGWRFVVADHFLVRTQIGYLQAVDSSSRVDIPALANSDPAVEGVIKEANKVFDEELHEVYTTYVKMPLVSVSAGYRF